MKNEIENEFAGIHNRLRLLEKKYNPEGENLHFAGIKIPDADLYAAIVSLAKGGLIVVQNHREYFLKNSLYADGMFWYDLFLMASSAALGVISNKAQKSIPKTEIRNLIEILVKISDFSTVNGGDITKRNHEALGNTLYAFYSDDMVELAREKGDSIGLDSVIDFVDWTIRRVEKIILGEKFK